MFKSEIEELGSVRMPPFAGSRAMMMPFHLEDTETVPFVAWRPVVAQLLGRIGARRGVGYLTLDEALVLKGETHRRPGLHVDGLGGWGGPSPYGYNGMILVSSHVGCAAYPGEYKGNPYRGGDCEHLRTGTVGRERVEMQPGRAYWCGPMALHEALPMAEDTHRQVLRVSMPSDEAWFEGYTPSPYGVLPNGPILPRRTEMDYRP